MSNSNKSSSPSVPPSANNSAGSVDIPDNGKALPEPGEYASLELLHPIIQFLDHDLKRTNRLTFSSLHVVSHSTKLYKEIYKLIKKVDNADSPDWVSYDKYSTAIEPLENLLFKFAADADSEKHNLSSRKVIEDLIAADASSVYKPTDCISVVTTWEADRDLVKKVLDDLKSQAELKTISELVESDAKENLKHDDETVLDALSENMKNGALGLKGTVANHWKPIKAKAEEICTAFKATKDIDDASSVKCVSSMMIVNEAMEAYKVTSTPAQGSNKEWNAHLKKRTVWDAAEALLTAVHDHIKDKTKVDYATLKSKYDAFIEALYSGKFELPSTLLDLIKKAARVKRPFYLQSLVLVAICKELADDFTKDTERSASKFIPLDETLTAGVDALTQAAKTIDDLQNLNETTHKQKSDALFGAVNAKLTECLNAYNKQDNDAKYKEKLTAALNKDKVALERIQTKLKGLTPFTQSKLPTGS